MLFQMNVVVNTKWSLTPEAFEKLLDGLDADRERAGEKYQTLRLKLIKFFAWEGCAAPEDCADEAFNRLAKRLAEGEQIQDINRYVYGIARLLVLEDLKRRQRERIALEKLPATSHTAPDEAADQQTTICLRHCLQRLPPENHQLILRYYQGESRTRIENRQRLARDMNIPLAALRKRALRLREKLESCIAKCLKVKNARDDSEISATEEIEA